MKNILIFFIAFIFFLVGFKPSLAGSYLTVMPPLDFYAVGNQVPIFIKITNTPANAKKINFYITDKDGPFNLAIGQPYLKMGFAPPPTGQETTFNYPWDTAAAGSAAGTHYFIAYLLDENENVIDQDTQSFNLLGSTGNPNTPTPTNSGTTGGTPTPTPTNSGTTYSGKAFNIANLGKIQFLPTKVNSIQELVIVIINWLLGLGGALAVIAIIYSGIMYMIAGADETKAQAAKKNLLWAITGIIVIVLAFVIIGFINQLLFTSP